jgi:hypothetical protein
MIEAWLRLKTTVTDRGYIGASAIFLVNDQNRFILNPVLTPAAHFRPDIMALGWVGADE